MIRMSAQIDSELANLAGKQLPFIASQALNRTAIGARDKVRANLPKRFRLRNNWTRGGIRAQMSSRANLEAAVVAPDYMGVQETGGERTSDRNRLLSAPSTNIQTGRVIPKSKRPKAALKGRAFFIDQGGGDVGLFQRVGRKGRKLRLLWWMTQEQEYDERFNFESDVSDYVSERFGPTFVSTFAAALDR